MQRQPHSSDSLKPRLLKAIEGFSSLGVLAVGDIMLDTFIWGEVNRISPEAPVPVVEVVEETRLLGGCANVAHNLAALGGRAMVAGIIGDDAAGEEMLRLISASGMKPPGVIIEPGRPTTTKTRIIARNQQVVRFDRESRSPILTDSLHALLSIIEGSLDDVKVIIVSDYAKGVVTADFMDSLRSLAKGHGLPILVDPKVEHWDLYREVELITPNHHEASRMAQIRITDESSLLKAGHVLKEKTRCSQLLITRGKDGMTLFEQDGSIVHIPTVARRVFDVTGAGDTVIATLGLGLAAGLGPREAALLANAAAGIVVGEVGTSVVSAPQLMRAVEAI